MSRKCPVCNSTLSIKQPIEINQQVVCSNCGLALEVIWLYPLELARLNSPTDGDAADTLFQKKSKKGIGSKYPASD
jgi:lysine biosynthesis protein LysW